MIKAYGFRCNKCCNREEDVVDDTRATFLVYAKGMAGRAGAEAKLQDAVKEHDLANHMDDGAWPDFKIVVLYTRKPRSRRWRVRRLIQGYEKGLSFLDSPVEDPQSQPSASKPHGPR